jgi:hypothetical protein
VNTFENGAVFKTLMRVHVDRAKGMIRDERVQQRAGPAHKVGVLRVGRRAQMEMMHAPLGQQTVRIEQ